MVQSVLGSSSHTDMLKGQPDIENSSGGLFPSDSSCVELTLNTDYQNT